jgi:hypothetical protein
MVIGICVSFGLSQMRWASWWRIFGNMILDAQVTLD